MMRCLLLLTTLQLVAPLAVGTSSCIGLHLPTVARVQRLSNGPTLSLLRRFQKRKNDGENETSDDTFPEGDDQDNLVACEVHCEDDPEPLVPAPAEVSSTMAPIQPVLDLLPTSLPDRPKAADTALAGLGLFATIALLGALEPVLGIPLFVPPMMASGIIFFAGPTPPDPKGFLSGTLCSATLSAGFLYILGAYLPPATADGASAALLLVWYKTVGSIFPPAAVLAGTLASTAASKAAESPNDALAAGATFLVTPWLAGHGALYLAALGLSPVRAAARVNLTQTQLRSLEGLSDGALQKVFQKYDTDESGALDAPELKVALRQVLGADLSLDDCEKLVGAADRDGNGVVDFQEFCFVCRGEVTA